MASKERDIIFSPQAIGNAGSETDEISKKVGGRPFRIVKRFIDARHKNDIKIVYRISFEKDDEDCQKLALPFLGRRFCCRKRPVIIGFGPAGMYAGLVLSMYGLNPVIIEKGRPVEARTRDVDQYKKEGKVDPVSNIQFGEGGAGTFSDGKLYTGVTSGLKGFISKKMIFHGAPSDILYDSHPHVGTDNLVNVVRGIREEIIRLGGEIHFEEELESFEFHQYQRPGKITGVITNKGYYPADNVILAIGNSSRELIRHYVKGLCIESKPFSIGVRIEHNRRDIDIAMYGFDTADYKNISAANYKMAVDTSSGKKLYTFCMCPGGVVVPSASTPDSICTNGMSYRSRDGINSNSALLVPFDPKAYGDDPLTGLIYQELLESKAYSLAGSSGSAPVMLYKDLKSGRSGSMPSSVKPTYAPSCVPCDLRELFSKEIIDTLTEGISLMGRKIKGFDSDDAVLTAVETRSSSPVRIPRDRDTYRSVACEGLFPVGEGAGYAGGIMSSAIDGIKCANAIAESMLI